MLEMIPKDKSLLTKEERTRANLDNIAKDILYKALDESLFPRVRKCKSAKDIWDTLMQIGEGDEQEKENKLTIAMKRFEDFKLGTKESISDMEARFMKLLMDIRDLDEEKLSQKEINLKILRGLPKNWEMKVVAMRDHRDLKTTSTTQIFSDLKAYEFEKEALTEEEPEARNVALVASQQLSSSTVKSNSNPSDLFTNDQFSLFMRKFKRFMRKNQTHDNSGKSRTSKHRNADKPSGSKTRDTEEVQMLCYNCRKPRHFKAECPYPIVKKHQEEYGNYRKNSGNYNNPKNTSNDANDQPSNYFGNNQKSERRRKALAVEEKPEEKTDEPCTSSSSSESDSSEDEKGLLCLFSQEESDEELCLMAKEDEVTSQNHSSNYSSESSYHENPREAFERTMKEFDDVRYTHFKLKEENAQLLAERQDLEDLKSKNAEMLESIS
ncbi:uncharacterized protein LOC116004010 [Ipomoea triloba]|uniref:uncharacterized protein LOC116004010 n=1 Tax=Ipomoea triloba TaxID=35885 RepID=UPI00125D9CE2|nr:uncharacterized protein LOC116004010 [Ipomoea triloba]